MRQFFLSILLCIITLAVSAQKYVSTESVITFFSQAPLEDIKAENKKASGALNIEKGDIAFIVPIKHFQFPKKLMQQHFNEKYMESDKYPNATFSGKLEGFTNNNSGTQQVTANGKLTIHGVTKNVTIKGNAERKNEYIELHSKFMVKVEDYNITIPTLLWQNIAEEVEVTVQFTLRQQ